MTQLRQHQDQRHKARGNRKVPRCLAAAVLMLAQLQPSLAAIVNDAVATGSYQGAPIVSTVSSVSIGVAPGIYSMSAAKSGRYRDSDGVAGTSAGDTISYKVSITNSGALALTGVTVTDPMIQLAYASGDITNPGVLDPGETWLHSGTYVLTANDIATNGGGDSDIDNTATISTNELRTRTVDAVAPLTINPMLATVIGSVFEDLDGDGKFDPGEPPAGAGYVIELHDQFGTVVGSALTDGNGAYSITVPPGSGYQLVFKRPGGPVLGQIDSLSLPAGQTIVDQNMPIDPSGVVYNSQTRQPVSGVTVTLTDSAGVPLPAACFLIPSQQNQVTLAGGRYRFDLLPGAAAACPIGETEYRIAITTPAGFQPGISTQLPPQGGSLDASTCPPDAIPGGACQVSGSNLPPTGSAVFWMVFLLAQGDRDIVNNHLPIDPIVNTAAGFTKRVLDRDIQRGERVAYVIEAMGTSINPATIVDVIPPGFTYISGSAQVNGVAIGPVIDGRNITAIGLVPDASGTIRLELTLLATAAVVPGNHTNTAQLIDEATGATTATARATVVVLPDHVFDCGEVIGRVFDDKNRNGYQDDGEPGLAGVRVATVKGLLVTSDKHGRFHVACADLPAAGIGSNFVMKLDTRTLPTGYRLTTENPRDVRLTAGKITKLNFGAAITRVVRLDLRDDAFVPGKSELHKQWLEALAKLMAVLVKEPSTLRITYHGAGESDALISGRLNTISKKIAVQWKKIGDLYRLPIETRVIEKD